MRRTSFFSAGIEVPYQMHFLKADTVNQFGRTGKIANGDVIVGPQAVYGDIDIRRRYVFQSVIIVFDRRRTFEFFTAFFGGLYLLFIFSKEIRQVVAVAGNGNFNFFFRLGDELYFCRAKVLGPLMLAISTSFTSFPG